MPVGADQVQYVVCPHTTVRWRQGRLTIASGTQPSTLTAHPAALEFLNFFARPSSLHSLMVADLSIELDERGALLRLLCEKGIIERLRPPANYAAAWWDPNDRAKREASLQTLIQVAHGFSASAKANFCVDHWGRPVPWIARPVLDFLFQLDLSEADVFEFGGGASTSYWIRRCRSLVCVESNPDWHNRLREQVGGSANLLLRSTPDRFARSILETDRTYDIILVDAAPNFRNGCAGPAIKGLAPGGMIILDDAPFYPEAAAAFRDAGLIEVDFSGYSPLEDNFQTTSLFLDRAFDFPRRTQTSPAFPFGSPHFKWADFEMDNTG